jgi:hypothetical protein
MEKVQKPSNSVHLVLLQTIAKLLNIEDIENKIFGNMYKFKCLTLEEISIYNDGT